MGPIERVDQVLQSQRGDLFPWVPVIYGSGIGAYFALRSEPSGTLLAVMAAMVLGCLLMIWLARRRSADQGGTVADITAVPEVAVIGATVVAIALSGFLVASDRSHSLAAPVLEGRSYGAIEGRVVLVDRSASDKLRITLDDLRLDRLPPERTPERVRVSLPDGVAAPPIGARVMTTAHLLPPQGPVEPAGFDFRRHAWFLQLGAVGYTRVPVLLIARPTSDLWIDRLRAGLSKQILSRMPADTGGFAVAITTGDRVGIPLEALSDLRASNLAHLLAISGLHMGLLTAVVFGGLRFAIALVPAVALRCDSKKWAALGALLAATVYLFVSGSLVASTRAYIMAAVMLVAVLLDRRALSLRSVALAAMIILTHTPEALISAGFQMSFAATVGLIAVFSALRDWQRRPQNRLIRGLTGIVVSSVVAGLATAPFAAAHFNVMSQYGLIANVLAVPVMGALVAPAAVLALLLSPIGGDWIGFLLMDLGIRWILLVAEFVAGLEGAQRLIPMPPAMVLPVISLGALLCILWKGRLRLVGVPVCLVALVVWVTAQRPLVLVAPDGGLVGIMTEQERALSRPQGKAFAAERWAENDASAVPQDIAAGLWPVHATEGQVGQLPSRSMVTALPSGGRLIHLMGKRAAADWQICDLGDVVVSDKELALKGDCQIVDQPALEASGSLALLPDGKWISTREYVGARLWTGAPALRFRPQH
ncbi:ComEC/Rec2 family competence protein [Phaeobacter sp.]|uniref:ComEC/Rec2 family competence protein n=1 Tax=Phaeobacter sp. TaxID=1902409 RepID=UPI0025E57B00|nr:ComEC/Rec2 family competence protein [Phaeobacter sp.]